MRGSPLWRAAIAFVLIASAGIPLWRLTHRVAAAPVVTQEVEKIEAREVQIEFTLTQPAAKLTIQHLGKRVWSGEAPEGRADATLTIPWPKEGVDLRVQIEWPESAPTAAARMVVTTAEGEYERSLWSSGPADKVLTFR